MEEKKPFITIRGIVAIIFVVAVVGYIGKMDYCEELATANDPQFEQECKQ